MPSIEVLLLILIGTIVVTGYLIYAAIDRLGAAVCSVSDPIATVLDRCEVHELQKDDVLPYLQTLAHCHDCETAAQEWKESYEARRRIAEGWRDLALPCPKVGCQGRWNISVKGNTGEIVAATHTKLCEHAQEMGSNPAEFFRPYAAQFRSEG